MTAGTISASAITAASSATLLADWALELPLQYSFLLLLLVVNEERSGRVQTELRCNVGAAVKSAAARGSLRSAKKEQEQVTAASTARCRQLLTQLSE